MTAKSERATIHSNWPLRGNPDFLPKQLPSIRLRHGQAIWLLTELGFSGAVSRNTFREYIKSLRKLGIPFGRERFQTKHRKRLAYYSYCRMMELAVTLSLRVYHVVPDSVLKGIVHYRSHLDRYYRRAYTERDSGAGRPFVIKVRGHQPIVFRGLYLDLNIKFSGGHMVRFGPPRLLPSIEALGRFSLGAVSARPPVPISLSFLSEQIIALALRAPDVRSGPHMRAAEGFSNPHHRAKISDGIMTRGA